MKVWGFDHVAGSHRDMDNLEESAVHRETDGRLLKLGHEGVRSRSCWFIIQSQS